MADIICRWRNGTPKTVVELVNSLPHKTMPNEEFRLFMQNSVWGSEFFHTPYQLACQLGLYCEAEDGLYYPRFDHDINEDEAKEYLEFWMPRYYVPNPYVGRNGFNDIKCPTYVLYELYKYATHHPNCTYKEAYKAVFQEEPTNNNDIVKNYINNYSKVLYFDSNGYLIITKENPLQTFSFMDRSNKKDFFDNFSKNNEYKKTITTLQQIFYGAPGTGKSHEIKRLTEGHSVIRTTFHPDSDYSTFVGCYKPTMDELDIHVVPVVVKSGISLQPPGMYKEKRITYKFVKQAFLKAYLSAWKKMCIHTIPHKNVSFKVGNAAYTIFLVDDNGLQQKKTDLIKKNRVGYTWKKLWSSGSFVIPTGAQPGESVQQAISKWIKDNYQSCTINDFDSGWDLLLSELKAKNTINVSVSKVYELSLGENDDFVLFSTVAKNTKERIEKCFNEEDEPKGVENGIIDILNGYDVDTFEDAWRKLKEDVMGSTSVSENSAELQFLIIEEINRGNCAQIFGDLFQLLDRNNNGFSEYPIEADTDLQQEIERAFNEPGEYHIDSNINAEGSVDDYTSNYGTSLSDDIQHGRVLQLPPNLYIWATMNTSDQSLFPIDSAFKRRWDWQYMPITDGKKGWKIEANGKRYDWWQFLQKINDRIGTTTNSEDKKLGYYFCKAKASIIDAETFVGKVLFYIWNDVYKDFAEEAGDLFLDVDGTVLSFSKFYTVGEDGKAKVVEDKVERFLSNLGVVAENETIDVERTDNNGMTDNN